MAFFGLTALGPQNTFEANSIHHRTLQIFEDEDFEEAWIKVNGKIGYCLNEKIGDVLRFLFHGPIPKNDVDPIEEAFLLSYNGSDSITFETYMKVMDKLRKSAEYEERNWAGKPKPECEFISSQEFRESLKKNSAIKNDPNKKQTLPLTGMQEVSDNIFNSLYHKLIVCLFSTDGSKQN